MVIIDDIPAVVEGIANDMPWSDYSIQVVGTAYNGLDGLKLIEQLNPDIIVTDIRMPKLSGIEMIERSKRTGAKLIFISGYSDFSYAQQVVKLGGFDYILKPFTPMQLVEVICKAKAQWDEENKRQDHLQQVERKLRESMPLLKQEYLNLLVRYTSRPEKVRERWDFLNVEMDDQDYAVLAVEIDRYSNSASAVGEVEVLHFAMHNILHETITASTAAVVFRDGPDRFICLVNDRKGCDILSIAEQCRENIERYSRATVSIGVGNTVRDIIELPLSYQQAMNALSYNFYSGGNSVFAYPDYGVNSDVYIKFSSDQERELIYVIRSGAVERLELVLDNIFTEWMEGLVLPAPEKVKVFCTEMMLNIRNALHEEQELEDHRFFDKKMEEMTYNSDSIRTLRGIVGELCHRYCQEIGSKQKASAHEVINESIQYIREHLELNESVADYARQVHLSTSYYSNLFKKVTGQSVLQFVVNEKMEKAKCLLIQGISLNEVAAAVGYDERSYFSDVFKKKVGMAPSEFRKTYQ
ncbi:response regulator [Paenibacillus sp. FSL R7-0345]|uniref:response regulator n=1 Tax=Paenibacillus sp. FSL R7-0345 TaxID=2954535 RepID=UPI00315A860C